MKIGNLDIDEKTGKVTANSLLFGHVSHHTGNPVNRNGYYFIPAVAGRKGSRKPHKTIKDCIPTWVIRNSSPIPEHLKDSQAVLAKGLDLLKAEGLIDEAPLEAEYHELGNDRKFIQSMMARLTANPLLVKPILETIAAHNEDFVKAVEAKRSAEASNVILDLIAVVVDPKAFNKLAPVSQKNLMHRVIAYHFPNGIAKGAFANAEREFYERFAQKEGTLKQRILEDIRK